MFFVAVVTVNFSESVYTVGEEDGQTEVCAVLTGQTERNITATVSTQSDTASGKATYISLLHSFSAYSFVYPC